MANNTYRATIDLSFIHNTDEIKINSDKIVYILIDSEFETNVLPVIYLSVSLNNELCTKVEQYKDDAKFKLSIKIDSITSSTSIKKTILSGLFSYIPSNTNPNYNQDLNAGTSADDSYKRIMIGLVDSEMTDKLRIPFNGFYNNIDTEAFFKVALDQINNTIIQKPTYNYHYDSVLVPPVVSRYKLLEWLYNKDRFYDSDFRFFMDYNNCYLVENNGEAVNDNSGKIKDIILDIKEVTEDTAYKEGYNIKNNAYYIYMNSINTNINTDQSTNKLTNEIIAVNRETGAVTKSELNINKSSNSTTKPTFIRANDSSLYKNRLEMNSAVIELMKQHIDGSIFTLDKSISVRNHTDYSQYNGKYVMAYKKEFFKSVAGEFVMSTVLGLRKVGNIESKHKTSDIFRSVATKKSSKRISSSNKLNMSNVRKASRK